MVKKQIFHFSLFTFHFFFVPLKYCFEGTFVRKNTNNCNFIWFFAHLFVPLHPLFPKAQRNISCDGELSSSINNLILE